MEDLQGLHSQEIHGMANVFINLNLCPYKVLSTFTLFLLMFDYIHTSDILSK